MLISVAERGIPSAPGRVGSVAVGTEDGDGSIAGRTDRPAGVPQPIVSTGPSEWIGPLWIWSVRFWAGRWLSLKAWDPVQRRRGVSQSGGGHPWD